MQLTTPKGLRLHIAIFGRTNVGKSSLLNCLTQQNVSIVSDQPGTTTDPVEKPMELLPIGPVLFIDTAGLDDISQIGKLRIDKTLKVFERADVIILVTEANKWTEYEEFVINESKKRNIPVIVALNKIDLFKPNQAILEKLIKQKIPYIEVSTKFENWRATQLLKSKLIEISPENFIKQQYIIADLIEPNDLVVLVIPIDKEAPKGRIILPQQMILREILDQKATAVVTNERQLKDVINTLNKKPKLVITDSQAFEEVLAVVPEDINLTSFSILLARNKGDLEEFIKGIEAISSLKDKDTILISETCSHHPIGDDIGRQKIPRWLKEKTRKDLNFEVVAGKDFPQDLKKYSLIIHCGACMINRQEMLSRIYLAKSNNVPITNYGLLIAYLKNGFERIIKIFRENYPLG